MSREDLLRYIKFGYNVSSYYDILNSVAQMRGKELSYDLFLSMVNLPVIGLQYLQGLVDGCIDILSKEYNILYIYDASGKKIGVI